MDKIFNIVIVGVGGQGLITLNGIIAKACQIEGYDVRTSELHGLSQREGAVQTYIRFGKKVYSPLVIPGKADLVLALESAEGLRATAYRNQKTVFVVNKNFIPYDQNVTEEYVLENLKSSLGSNLYLVSASEICKDKLQNEVVSSAYLLGCAINKNLIPLKLESAMEAIKKVIPQKYQELNIKAIKL